MKLKIKDFIQHKKLWLSLIGALIIALGGWYYFWVYAPQQPGGSLNEVQQMTKFTVKDTTLDTKTVDKYFASFDTNSKLFQAHPDSLDSFQALLQMGLIKQLVGDYQGAEQIFLYDSKLEPNSYVLNGDLGHLYLYYLKNYPAAEKYYQLAISEKPISGNLYSYYSEMYDLYHDGFKDPTKTQQLLTDAIKALPDNTSLLRLAGEYYKSIGDKTSAIKYYQQALKLDPHDTASKQALEQLSH